MTLPQPAASGLESIHLGGKDLPSLALGREIHSFPRTPACSILLFLCRFAIQRPAALRCPRRGLIYLSHLEVPGGGALTLSHGGGRHLTSLTRLAGPNGRSLDRCRCVLIHGARFVQDPRQQDLVCSTVSPAASMTGHRGQHPSGGQAFPSGVPGWGWVRNFLLSLRATFRPSPALCPGELTCMGYAWPLLLALWLAVGLADGRA